MIVCETIYDVNEKFLEKYAFSIAREIFCFNVTKIIAIFKNSSLSKLGFPFEKSQK